MTNDEKTIVEEVMEFIRNTSNKDSIVEMVATLYDTILELARENGALELENSLLTRQLDIAENHILNMEKDKETKNLLS